MCCVVPRSMLSYCLNVMHFPRLVHIWNLPPFGCLDRPMPDEAISQSNLRHVAFHCCKLPHGHVADQIAVAIPGSPKFLYLCRPESSRTVLSLHPVFSISHLLHTQIAYPTHIHFEHTKCPPTASLTPTSLPMSSTPWDLRSLSALASSWVL